MGILKLHAPIGDISPLTKIIDDKFNGLDERQYLLCPDQLRANAYALMTATITKTTQDWVLLDRVLKTASANLSEARISQKHDMASMYTASHITSAPRRLEEQQTAVIKDILHNLKSCLSSRRTNAEKTATFITAWYKHTTLCMDQRDVHRQAVQDQLVKSNKRIRNAQIDLKLNMWRSNKQIGIVQIDLKLNV